MNFENLVISRLLYKQDVKEYAIVKDKRLMPEMFQDQKLSDAFQWLVKYATDNPGQLPSLDLFEHEYPDIKLIYPKDSITYYIEKIKETYIGIQGQQVLLDSASLLVRSPKKGLAKLKSGILDIDTKASDTLDVKMNQNTDERLERYLKGEPWGYVTRWETLNNATYGFHGGELVTIIARPYTGKTYFLLAMAVDFHKQGVIPLIVTKEMSKPQIESRIDAIYAQLPYDNFKGRTLRDVEFDRYKKYLKDMKERQPIIITEADTLSAIGAKAKLEGAGVILIDGAYILSDDNGATDLWEKTTNIASGSKKLAMELNVPVIETWQFKRGADIRTSDTGLDDIGLTDAVGQYSDDSFGIYKNKDLEIKDERIVKFLKVRESREGKMLIKYDISKPIDGEEMPMQFKEMKLDDGAIDGTDEDVLDF